MRLHERQRPFTSEFNNPGVMKGGQITPLSFWEFNNVREKRT